MSEFVSLAHHINNGHTDLTDDASVAMGKLGTAKITLRTTSTPDRELSSEAIAALPKVIGYLLANGSYHGKGRITTLDAIALTTVKPDLLGFNITIEVCAYTTSVEEATEQINAARTAFNNISTRGTVGWYYLYTHPMIKKLA